jgi:exopolysaccharide production protein ExoY
MTNSTISNPAIDQFIVASEQVTTAYSVMLPGKHKGIPMFLQRSLALIALICLSPMLMIVMFLLRLESRGNCFFSQDRIGKYGRHLKTDRRYAEPDPSTSDRDGICKKYRNDSRISIVGAFIRKYSIDELPQLINIVKGDMALIGPRPALAIEVNAYPTSALCRLNGMPGLSGLWQVSGRADTDFDTQVTLDERYLQKQSIGYDIRILLATLPCVFGARGAY